MFRVDERTVAALFGQTDEEKRRGYPPRWNSYVSVDDLAAAVQSVEALGGNVLTPPLDLADTGRLAVAADPTGGLFSMWEPGAFAGADLVNAAGALTWNELATDDTAKAKDFYGGLFGWRIEDQTEPFPYTVIYVDGRPNGGMRSQGPEESGVPPHWLPYFATASCDTSVAKLKELGGNIVYGPVDIPRGRLAVVQDPQGAMFALLEGEFED
jgi:predicted enzyme related to lactoylglutathione lyase